MLHFFYLCLLELIRGPEKNNEINRLPNALLYPSHYIEK